MPDENTIIRFEDIGEEDREGRVRAAIEELRILKEHIMKSIETFNPILDEDKETVKKRDREYVEYIMRSFDYVGTSIDASEKFGKIVDTAGLGAKIARKESNDLNRRYGRSFRK